MDKYKLKNDLLEDEGFVSHAYEDHLGFLTIGIGRLIDKRRGGGISLDEAQMLLWNDIDKKQAELVARWPRWNDLSEVRQRAIMNMAFQLGVEGLMKFKKAIKAMEIGNYERAALEFLDSKWAQQTPLRARKICDMIKKNKES